MWIRRGMIRGRPAFHPPTDIREWLAEIGKRVLWTVMRAVRGWLHAPGGVCWPQASCG